MTTLPPLSEQASAAACQLRSSLHGGVLLSTDASYDTAGQIWNGAVLIIRQPAVD
jgi:hypothetical protein